MKKPTTLTAVVPAANIEEAWREVGASFERFCLTAGLATLSSMMEEDAVQLCGPRYGRGGRQGRASLGEDQREIGLPTVLARGILSIEGRVEQGAIFQHGAGDIEQAVGDRSEGTAMAVTPAAQRGVLGLACRIKLNGDTRAQWYMTLASRLLQACLRMTMQLLPDFLVTGATPVRLRKAA